MRRSLIAVCLALNSLALAATPLHIPERFFRGNVRPDGSVELVYTKPNLLDPQQAADLGWWNAVAKFKLLLRDNANFRAAYEAAKKDPFLQATGVTSADWSSGTQDQKEVARTRMHEAVQRLIAKHRLQELLLTMATDEQQVVALATALRTGQPQELPLIKYCPGSEGNISLNPQHHLFAQFQLAIKEPETSQLFQTAITDFGSYLAAHPTASENDRNAELSKLVAPILSKVH